MFISLPFLIGGVALVALLLVLALRGRSGRDDLMGSPRSGGASPKPASPLRQPAQAMPMTIGPELEANVRALIAKGQKIEAIKQIRDGTGLGLKEAKDAVEALGG